MEVTPHWARPAHHELPRGSRMDGLGHDGASLNRRPRQSTAPAGLFAPAPEVVVEKVVKPRVRKPRPSQKKDPADYKKRPAAACGTVSGYSRHRRLGEPICQACTDANREYKREYNRKWAESQPKRVRKTYTRPDCGTPQGYDSHRAHKERVCDPCRLAENERQQGKRRALAMLEGREIIPRAKVAVCGTASGYKKHRRNGEQSCEPCLAAKRVNDAAAHARKKARETFEEAAA